MKDIKLELISNDPNEIHENIKDKFRFPAYYGRNLDALYDCLCEICESTLVEIILDENEVYHRNIWNVMKDASEANSYLTIMKVEE